MLNEEQKDFLFGTLLGDGSLQTFSDGRTWRYRAVHKKAHKEYILHKYQMVKSFCSTGLIYGEVFDWRTGRMAKRYYFNTKVDPSLKFYADMFLTRDPDDPQTWIKNVPLNVEKFLNPRALAYFYMDDGALKWLGHSNAMRICTEGFTVEGVKRLQKALKNRYDLKTSLSKKRLEDGSIRYRITILEESSADFREIIRPYLVNCMKYKCSDGNRFHL